jgi:O-antigen/teichoic acid export membrane protein
MGLVTALRFVEGVYRSSIVGLQRQVLFNTINGIMATVRGVGALGVLAWVSPTIEAFFIWQALVSIAIVGVLASATYSSLPRSERGGCFSKTALKEVWRFAGGMLGITFLALLLTQVDKILLSKLLSLKDFGYYTLAATVAGSLHLLIGPIIQAWYPRLCALYAAGDEKELIKSYHHGAQLISTIAGSAGMVLVFFSESLLHLWTQDEELVRHVAPLLRLLATGTLLNGLMWIPFQTQLAHGWTLLSIHAYVIAVLVIVPAILWVTPRYGALGASLIWVVLNAGNILIVVQFMYRRILKTEKWNWYIYDLLAPLSVAFLVSGSLRLILEDRDNPFIQLMILIGVSFLTVGSAALASEYVRKEVRGIFIPIVEKQEEVNS